MFGVPRNPEDPTRLASFMKKHRPPYKLLADLAENQVARIREVLRAKLHMDATPTTLLLDGEGHVLHARIGAPTVSEIRELLARE